MANPNYRSLPSDAWSHTVTAMGRFIRTSLILAVGMFVAAIAILQALQ